MKKNHDKLYLKYAEALRLYRETAMSQKEICTICSVSVSGFRSFLQRYCREDLSARYKVGAKKDLKLHGKKGQSLSAHARYHDAVQACDSKDFITYTVSQIAQHFNVSPSGLGNQLRMHYPEILERRRNARSMMGLKNHMQEKVIAQHAKQYWQAVSLLSQSGITIKEAAEKSNVSFSGLRQHLIFYHRDLLLRRLKIRESGRHQIVKGLKNGNNMPHLPFKDTEKKYSEALRMYINSSKTISEIAEMQKVTVAGFYGYIKKWFPEFMHERRNYVSTRIEGRPLSESNSRYLKSTAFKYAEAIDLIRSSNISTADAARAFGHNPAALRTYLRTHFPELAEKNGMSVNASGARMSRRSYIKYSEAIDAFMNSEDSLHSIAVRMGLRYNSLYYFVKRNFPDILNKKTKKRAHKSDVP